LYPLAAVAFLCLAISLPAVNTAPCAVHDVYVFLDGQPADAVIEAGGDYIATHAGHATLPVHPQSIAIRIADRYQSVELCGGPSTIVELFTVSCHALDHYGNMLYNTALYIDGSASPSTAPILSGVHAFQCSYGGVMFDLGRHAIFESCSINAKLAVSDMNLQILEALMSAPDGTHIEARSSSTGYVYGALTEGGKVRFPALPFGTYNVSADGAWAIIAHNSSSMKRLTLASPADIAISVRNCYLLLPVELSLRVLDRYGVPVAGCTIEILQNGISRHVDADRSGSATVLIPPSLSPHETIVVIGGGVKKELLIDRNPAPALLIPCGIVLIACVLAKRI
jgi:hypothetical protein